ncbi:hypothetical protein DRN63_01675 [Nanoarchaeota archaeon]|nr:MAG: hypothetical protein DRN63_01675 [Nanoarchaeota archaeon]
MVRPFGVAVLAILGLAGGLGSITLSLTLIVLGNVITSPTYVETPLFNFIMRCGPTFFLVYGIVALIVSYGLWVGKTWAWWFYTIILILGILTSLISIPYGIVGIVVNGIIIYYMTRSHVRQYFGVHFS